MLFRKEIEPRCAYCQHGTDIGEESVACLKKGVMDSGSHCGSFRYDPFKRVPRRRRDRHGHFDHRLAVRFRIKIA